MSKLAGQMYHPINGSTEDIYEGFSWPCLFLGVIWFLYKGMWRWAAISFILALFTFGISWLVFPFSANSMHKKFLVQQGYLNDKQWSERKQVDSGTSITELYKNDSIHVADEISKLKKLMDEGVLSEEEFIKQKNKLLS